MSATEDDAYCVLIPAYREGGRIAGVVSGVKRHCAHVVVVDDGSADTTADEARAAGATVLRHEANRGKGAALATGFAYAQERGFAFAIAMDADGQHAPEDIPAFVAARRDSRAEVLVGNRMDATGGMPTIRRWTNRYMSWLLSRRMGQWVPDTQCGYRLIDRAVFPLLLATEASGYAAESESLLRLAARGVKIGSVPIRVIYGDEKSSIHPVRDTVRFFRMLRRYDRGRASASGHAPAA